MNITEFKKKNQPKKVSNLKKFESEILELHSAYYSLKNITQFLQSNGVKTTFQNVSRFIKSINIDSNAEIKNNKKVEEINNTDKKSLLMPKLEKIGKDLDLKEAPDWAN